MSASSLETASISKILFLDDHVIDEKKGLTRTFHEAVKCADSPVITADRPWERDAAFVDSGLVLYDEAEELFKAWYQGGACYGPDDGSCMCYATSTNGLDWDKPSLGVIDFEGSRDNNIVHMATCEMHDPAPIVDPADPDPARLYKAIWWGGRRDSSQEGGWLLGHCVGFSPDGIHWTEHPDNPVWPADGEVAIPSGLERRAGRHIMYCSADGHGLRVVARTESDDFVRWELPPRPVLMPDEHDAPGTEMAGLCAVNDDHLHIGMLYTIQNLQIPAFTREQWQSIVDRNIQQGCFGPPIEMNKVRCRSMHTELVCSHDGFDWQRVHRKPLIPLGPRGSWDESIVLAGRPLVVKDRIFIYYTGQGRTSQTPGGPPEPIADWNVDTGLATLRADGYASLDAGSSEGLLVTEPFSMHGRELVVNVEAPSGSVRVAVLDDDGRAIQGFQSPECDPVTGDHVRATVRWGGNADVSVLRGRRVRLKIVMKDARLYSVSMTDRVGGREVAG